MFQAFPNKDNDQSSSSTSQFQNCLNSFPLCPFCNKDFIILEHLSILKSNYEPYIEFSCSCLINSSGERNAYRISIQDYLQFLSNNISKNVIKKCYRHPTKNGIFYCLNCELNMCTECNEYHRNFEKNHICQYAYKINDIKCLLHSNVSFYYCLDCNKYICESCLNGDHYNHQAISLEDYWLEIFSRLKIKSSDEMLNYSKIQFKNMNDFTNDQIDKIDQMISQLNNIKYKIMNYFRVIKNANSKIFMLCQLFFNNFNDCKISPKLTILHNMEKINLHYGDIINKKLLEKLNNIIRNIEKNFIDFQGTLYENFSSLYLLNLDNKNITVNNYAINKYFNDDFKKPFSTKQGSNSTSYLGNKRVLNKRGEFGEYISDTSNYYGDDNPAISSSVNEEEAANYNEKKSFAKRKLLSEQINPKGYESNASAPKQDSDVRHNPKSVKEIAIPKLLPKITQCFELEDKILFVAGTKDKGIAIINILSGNPSEKKLNLACQGTPTSISSTLYQKSVVFISFDEIIRAIDLKTMTFTDKNFIGHSKQITQIVIDEENKALYTASEDRTAKKWNAETGLCLGTYLGNSFELTTLLIYSQETLITAAKDGKIKLWSINKYKCLHDLVGHQGAIFCLVQGKNEKSNLIMSSSADYICKVWDVEKKNCIATITENATFVNSIVWLDNGTIVTAEQNCLIKLWDDEIFENSEQICSGHTKGISHLISLSNTQIFTCGEDEIIKLWDI